MVNIEERKINIEEAAKKKFDIIGNFIGCKPKIINGSIRSIAKTNISYIEPHRIIYKDTTFLFFNFTIEDILLKRDLKFLNSIKFPTLYEGIIKEWNDLDREKKYQIIMNYIENIDLRYTIGKGYEVNSVNFRKAFFKDFNKLFSNGYIDFNKNYVNNDNKTRIRISNTLTDEQIEKYITKLKRKYNIIYNVGKLYNPIGKIDVGDKSIEDEILRVFPIEGKIADKETDLGVVSFNREKLEKDDFYDYVRKLPTVEEILDIYLQNTNKKYTIKNYKIIQFFKKVVSYCSQKVN